MISRELFEFIVCDLKCPYDGKIKGLGKAYSHLVINKDTVPNTLETNLNGDFYQPGYVSVVGPAVNNDNELVDKIREQIIKRNIDGTHDIWDVRRKRTLHFGNKIKDKIAINGSYLSIEISDELDHTYADSIANIQEYLNELESGISWGQVIFDTAGGSLDYSELQSRKLKNEQLNKKSWDLKKKAKKITGKKNPNKNR